MSGPSKELTAYFGEQGPPELIAAYLFGSAARGAEHAQSDVDVAVLLDRGRLPDRSDRAALVPRLIADLIAATHCNEVDLVVLNDAPPELVHRATEEGIRVYCHDAEADRRFRLQNQLRHIDLKPFLRRMRHIKAEALRS